MPGLSQNLWQFAIFRVLLGLGMGGEWASGATLVSETWPEKHRGKALGLMQSCWAIGYGLAAIVVAIVLPRFGWRAVFFVGIVPASRPRFVILVTVDEPRGAIWGGVVAAPAFQQIARFDLQYLEVPPDAAPAH